MRRFDPTQIRKSSVLTSTLFVAVALVLFATLPVSAGQAPTSRAAGQIVDLTFTPAGGTPMSVNLAPSPEARAEGGAAETQSATVSGVSLTTSELGRLLAQRSATSSATVSAAAPGTTAATVTVKGLSLWLAGQSAELSLSADMVSVSAGLSGQCGAPQMSGTTALSSVFAGGLLGKGLVVPSKPDPDTLLIDANGLRVVLNEQLAVGLQGGWQSFTVNAVHASFNQYPIDGGTLSGDLVVGHVEAMMPCASQAAVGADLQVDVVDRPDPAFINYPIRYFVTITNFGPGDASEINLVDDLPQGVLVDRVNTNSAPATNCAEGTDQILCKTESLAAGASITLVIKVVPQVGGQIFNSVNVTARQQDPNSSNNSVATMTGVCEE